MVLASRPRELARAALFGLGTAVLGGLVLGFVPFLGLLGLALLGFLVGRAVSEGAHRKRGYELPPLAAACYLAGSLLAMTGRVALSGAPPEMAAAVLVGALVQPLSLAGLTVGALLAWMQNR